MLERIYRKIKKFDNIYIFGAGKVGKAILEQFMIIYPDIKIKAIIVSDLKNNPLYIYGIPVFEINSINFCKDTVVVLAVYEKHIKEIIEKLTKAECDNIVKVNSIDLDDWETAKEEYECLPEKFLCSQRYVQPYINTLIDLERIKGSDNDKIQESIENKINDLYNKKKLDIARLVITLGSKCSLRCKECNNLIPNFVPQRDYDYEKILSSIERLVSLASSVLKCELIGGEPFLTDNLYKILPYLINQSKIHSIEITTNGTIIPRRSYISLLQNPKVRIRISDYGTIVNQVEFISFCKKNHMNYTVLELGKWISPGGVNKRNKNIKDLKREYGKCSSGYLCKTLHENKLFSCSRSASLYELGYMIEKEYVSIDEDTTIDMLKSFFTQGYSFACDYCDLQVKNRKYVDPAIQISKINT
ncbi:MAG TPA: 4Fe-4S cluster-binding domain-containing protein [Clostridiales bacterium]|nr:4Fe-4S cluster-binding domain-containing protein [Clostridiales bacterium]